jgi:hypothetical protein
MRLVVNGEYLRHNRCAQHTKTPSATIWMVTVGVEGFWGGSGHRHTILFWTESFLWQAA